MKAVIEATPDRKYWKAKVWPLGPSFPPHVFYADGTKQYPRHVGFINSLEWLPLSSSMINPDKDELIAIRDAVKVFLDAKKPDYINPIAIHFGDTSSEVD